MRNRFLIGVILGVLAVASVASAQYVGGGSIGAAGGGGGGAFTGGTLSAPLGLDGANTTCADPIAMSFEDDTNSGIQPLTDGTWQMCVDGVRAGFLDYAPDVTVIGRGNTAIGYNAGPVLDTNGVDGAYNNAFFGGQAGQALTKGFQNTFLGDRSGTSCITGDQNTCVGQGSCFYYLGDAMTSVGYHAGLNITGENNLFFGHRAGEGVFGSATGTNNVGLGKSALQAVTTGGSNIAIGSSALLSLAGGTGNVSVGYLSGDAITSGIGNILMGSNAGGALTTQSYNVAIGNGAGDNLTDTQNVVVGAIACDTCTTAAGNTLVGYAAGAAGTTLTTGDGNVLIGRNVDAGSATAANRIVIGDAAQGGADNQVTIGNTSVTSTRLRGAVQLGGAISTTPTEPVACDVNSRGSQVYVDDTDDGARGRWCGCISTDDTAYDWVLVDDNASACPFF